MSTYSSQSDPPETEELVAYLDGELTGDECRRVERRLASDADYRRRLTELEQAWSALETLPPTVVADDFARTTIEMVTVVAKREAQAESAAQNALGRRRTYWLAAGGLAVALVAFMAARTLLPSQNRALVDDLPVIANLDVLSQVEDVDYLRGLTKLDFDVSLRNDDRPSPVVSGQAWETFDDRRRWIEGLPADEKAELAGKLDRFERLAPAPQAQDRLRDLEREIAAAPDHAKLEQTLAAYGAWVERLTPGKQLELREARSVEDRQRLVGQLLEQSERAARRQLSQEDEKALQDAILSIVEERRGELVQEVGRQGHPDPERRIGERRASQVALVIIWRDMQNDERRAQLQDRLTARLSPEAQDYLKDLDGRQRTRQLMRWVYDAVGSKVGPQSLEEFFTEELTNDQREYLLGLSSVEMKEQLEQMYMRSQVGLRDDDFPQRLWRGGPGGRGPWDRGRGDRGRRDGPGREFERGRFDGPPPFPPGPDGPGPRGRDGRPPGPPPPRDGRDWRPPPDGMGPPPSGRPREEPI
jgi:hypothetical protein